MDSAPAGTRLCEARFNLPAGTAVDFGVGAVHRVADHVAATGTNRVFVVTDNGLRSAGLVEQLVEPLVAAGLFVDVFDEVLGNPSVSLAEQAAERLRGNGCDVVVGFGGGSSIDIAKGVAVLATNPSSSVGDPVLHPALPVIAVPTTAGTGSETNGFGVLEDPAAKTKIYCGHDTATPRVAVLDPLLTVELPVEVTASTGVDALVHGIESLTSRGRNRMSEIYATEAIALAQRWLPLAVTDGTDLEARSRMMFAAHLAGLALTRSGLGLVHGIAHSLSLHCRAPHGLALSAVLPAVVEFSLCCEPDAYDRLAGVMSVANRTGLPEALHTFVDQVGTAVTIGDLGACHDDREAMVVTALADPVTMNTPRIPTDNELDGLLRRCW